MWTIDLFWCILKSIQDNLARVPSTAVPMIRERVAKHVVRPLTLPSEGPSGKGSLDHLLAICYHENHHAIVHRTHHRLCSSWCSGPPWFWTKVGWSCSRAWSRSWSSLGTWQSHLLPQHHLRSTVHECIYVCVCVCVCVGVGVGVGGEGERVCVGCGWASVGEGGRENG